MMECHDQPIFDISNNFTRNSLETLFTFRELYSTVHRYVAVVLCVLGLMTNGVHIWVLTRPKMRHSSVHTVLTCIACADIGTMTSYLLYMYRFEFNRDFFGYPFTWALFLKVHVVLSIALHAISLYLVVLMAFIRFSAMQAAHSKWLENKRAALASGGIAFAVFCLCIPTLLSHQVKAQRTFDEDTGEIHSAYSIGFSEMVMENNCVLMKANLWLTGIMLKAVPCALLFWFTVALVLKMREQSQKRQQLLHKENQKRRGDLTTYMLLFMVSVFLITELPQGIMAILNALFTSQFHAWVYLSLADVLDLLSLINCYVAFLVYTCTSTRYRTTLLTILPNVQDAFSALNTRQNTLIVHKREKNRVICHQMDRNVVRASPDRSPEKGPPPGKLHALGTSLERPPIASPDLHSHESDELL